MKIFCIGFNKTGTTSLQRLLLDEGFIDSRQEHFEQNLDSYVFKNYSTYTGIIKTGYSTSNIFQDIPFSLPNFYKELYKEFPEAYYILTVRDSSEVWYNSLDRFYKKSFPNKYHKIHEIEYIRKGWLYSYLTDCLNSPKTEPLNKSSLVAVYENHISDVEEFFKDKPNLIKINLTNPLDFNRLEKFLGNKFKSTSFPHLNKT